MKHFVGGRMGGGWSLHLLLLYAFSAAMSHFFLLRMEEVFCLRRKYGQTGGTLHDDGIHGKEEILSTSSISLIKDAPTA